MSKNILIFGSTGMTGLCALESAVSKENLKVRVFIRDPTKLPANYTGKVETIVGDVLNYEEVNKAMENIDAVVVVLGTRNDLQATTALSEGMKNIIKAMKQNNVECVSVCLSAFLFYEESKVPAMFKDLNADHQRQYDALKSSSLKYVAVLPPHIADTPARGYKIEFDKSPARQVSKYDLGAFLVDSVFDEQYYGKTCGITSKSAD